jgi:hypothetical protein
VNPLPQYLILEVPGYGSFVLRHKNPLLGPPHILYHKDSQSIRSE